MGRIKEIFWPNSPWWVKKKFNSTHHISPTQPNPHESSWTQGLDNFFLLLLLLNWAEKKNINILRKKNPKISINVAL